MKRFLLIACFCAVSIGAGAQNLHRQWLQQDWERTLFQQKLSQDEERDYTNVRFLEIEIGLGGAAGSRMPNGTSPKTGLYFVIEPRYNFANYLDVGLQSSVATLLFKGNGRDGKSHSYSIDYSPVFAFIVDYNWRNRKNLSLFAGLGAGAALVDCSDYYGEQVFVNPRIGAEFFNHLRLTLEYKLMNSKYSFFGLTIGGVIGGGYKK